MRSQTFDNIDVLKTKYQETTQFDEITIIPIENSFGDKKNTDTLNKML